MNSHSVSNSRQMELLKEVHAAIAQGADAFLRAEYGYCIVFEALFGILVFALISWGQNVYVGALTTLAFVLGAGTSILSGYIGMKGMYLSYFFIEYEYVCIYLYLYIRLMTCIF